MAELLNCPFCGGEASVRDGGPGCKFVQCDTCNATSDDGSIERVTAAWNVRVETALEIVRGNIDEVK